MYGLTGAQTRPGTPLRDILAARVANGNGPMEGGDFVARRLAEAARSDYFHTIIRLADGRMIAITHQPVAGLGGVAIHQDVTAEKRAEASLIAKSEELERANMRFDAALNNMSQGLCMFDAEQRIVVANNRFARDLRLHPGPDQAGHHGAAAPRVSHRQRQLFRASRPTSTSEQIVTRAVATCRRCADGRVISILRHRLPDGGVLTTHEDITERRQKRGQGRLHGASRPADRARQPHALHGEDRGGGRTPAPARRGVHGLHARPRPLQGRQRLARPPGRRRAAQGDGAAAEIVAARDRRAGAPRRRRVRDPAERRGGPARRRDHARRSGSSRWSRSRSISTATR